MKTQDQTWRQGSLPPDIPLSMPIARTPQRDPEKQKAIREDGLLSLNSGMVPGVGLEPTRLATADFESAASTDFATRATARDYTNGASACKGFFVSLFSFAHLFNALPLIAQLLRMPSTF